MNTYGSQGVGLAVALAPLLYRFGTLAALAVKRGPPKATLKTGTKSCFYKSDQEFD